MAELTSRDRLQPSLLDRLIDKEPLAQKETAEARVLTRQQLRQAVLRDLSWLLNTTRAEPEPESVRSDEIARWSQAEFARKSVLNYGTPAFAGSTLSSMDRGGIERGVTEAIVNFEPRIDPATLQVEVKIDPSNSHNTIQLIIRGQLWSQPVPLELLLTADMDIETGNTRVRELRS
jgi:type VI secretion system protein ImpF